MIDNNLVLQIGSEKISRKPYLNFLGIYIDEKLNWHHHIDNCKTKLSCSLYAISRVKRIIPVHCLKTLYYGLALPHLMYGDAEKIGPCNI